MEYRNFKKVIRTKIEDIREFIEIKKWNNYSKEQTNSIPFQLSNPFLNILDENTLKKMAQISWGSLIYDSRNLGDEIQTLAAINLIPNISKLLPIHREHLNQPQFSLNQPSLKQQDNLPIFLNGWFTHLPNNWPPHESLKPIFVGFHINEAKKELFNVKHRDYYNSNGPIGCRDKTTVKYLESIGVEAFFTGCPTITLRNPEIERSDRILIVDAHQKSADVHIPDPTRLLSLLVPNSILEKAQFVTHNVDGYKYRRHGYKLKQAIALLKSYASAKLVITSRLHCALPCLAFGTPCIFLNPSLHSDPRLIDFRPILNGYSSPTEKININWEHPEPNDVTEFQKLIYLSVAEKFRNIFTSPSK